MESDEEDEVGAGWGGSLGRGGGRGVCDDLLGFDTLSQASSRGSQLGVVSAVGTPSLGSTQDLERSVWGQSSPGPRQPSQHSRQQIR